MNNLNELLRVLSESRIDFIVIGGFAAVLHGSSHVTHDLDLCVSISASRVLALREALRPYNPIYRGHPKRLSFLDVPNPPTALKNIYLQTDLGALDILSHVTGVGNFDDLATHAIDVDLFGQSYRVMGLDDLLKAKQAMARPKDQLVYFELSALREKRGMPKT